MPDPALLDPNNRLLGWSANDFSLYGGQPTVTLGMPRADEAGGAFVSVPSALPSAAPAVRDAADLSAAPPPAGSIAPADGGDAGPGPTSFLGTQAAPTLVPAPGASSPAPGVPDPVGSGSLAPAGIVTPLAAVAESGGIAAPLAASPLAAPVLDLAPPTAPAGGIAAAAVTGLATPVLDLAAPTAGLVAATALGEVAATADAAATLLDGLTTTLPLDAVATTLAPATGALDATGVAIETTAGAATDALGEVTAAAGNTVTDLTDTADGVAAAAGGTLGEVTAAVGPAAAATAATTTGTAATVTDAVGGAATLTLDPADLALGGSDPAGGVATLVGMVEAADQFDLGQTGTGPAPVTEGGSILDALAADEAPGALLGVDEGGDGLLGGGHQDDHDGGLLGGL